MQRIELDNFRVFGSPASFDLAPVTVLTGKNNSGKSSLIKAFLVLADYLEQDDQTVLRLDGPRSAKHRITSFASLRNNSVSDFENVSFSYATGDFVFEYDFDNDLDSTKAALFQFIIHSTVLKDKLVLQRISSARGVFELSVSQNFIDYLTGSPEEKDRIVGEGYYERELAQARKDLRFFQNGDTQLVKNELGDMERMSGAWLESPSVIEERQRLTRRIEALQEMVGVAKTNAGVFFRSEVTLQEKGLIAFTIPDLVQEALAIYIVGDSAKRVKKFKFQDAASERKLLVTFRQRVVELMSFSPYHLGPNRTHQARLFIPQQGSSEIGAVAKAFVQARVAKDGLADQFLQAWLDRFEIGKRVDVNPFYDTGYSITVAIEGLEEPTSLADLGYGSGQLLAILLHIATVIQERETLSKLRGQELAVSAIILIEEPEANLHPFLQSLLAEMFLEVAKQHRLLVIVETHSEYMLRKMQLLVAGQKCAPEDVVMHYLERTRHIGEEELGGGTFYAVNNRRITILPDGKLSEEFGPGFFDEADESAMALFREQKKAARAQKTSSL